MRADQKTIDLLQEQVRDQVTRFCISNNWNRGSILDWEWSIDYDADTNVTSVSMTCQVIAQGVDASTENVRLLTYSRGDIVISETNPIL